MMVLLGVLAVLGLLVVEVWLRLVAHALPGPFNWHDRATQVKEDQVEALRRRGGVDVVFVGTSMMLFSVDPDVINSETGLRTYNASIYRAVPSVSHRWLQDVVIPRLRPPLVVVGLSAFDLNDNGLLATRYDEYLAAPRFSYGPMRRALMLTGRYSHLARYAFLAKRPRVLARSLIKGLRDPQRRSGQLPTLPGAIGPSGQGLEFEDRSFAEMPGMTDLIRRQAVQDWEDRGVQRRALRQIFDDVRASGGDVLFLTMPVTVEFTHFFSGGEDRWREIGLDLVREVRSWGGTVMTLEGYADRTYFADMIHMNARGRQAFSASLAAELRRHKVVAQLLLERAGDSPASGPPRRAPSHS